MASFNARVAAALVVVALVVGTCSGAHGQQLEVHNEVAKQTIAVYYPPGQACCIVCPPGQVCPDLCRLCTDVNLNYGQCGKLNSTHAGPYPLSYLKINIPATGANYCVGDNDLPLLTNHALVTVSSVACGTSCSGLAASVSQIQGDSGSRVCTHPAIITDTQVICLVQC